MEREEGEMSDEDSSMLVDEVDPKLQLPKNVTQTQQTITYKADKHGLLVQQLEKVDASKLEERAKRFGLDLTGSKVVTQRQIDELYANFGIESGNERHFRFDTIHLNGVDRLTTRDIFEYLEDFKPVSLEWIDDSSCNIVCQDHITAALALLVHSREIKREDLKNMLDLENSPHHWREGAPHPKNDLIFMRFATNGDKKMLKKKSDYDKHPRVFDDPTISKNPWGDLCQTWGVYDHQEIFQRKLPDHEYDEEDDDSHEVVQVRNKKLALRLGKRSHKTLKNYQSDDSNSDTEWKKKSKTPRMRMHADDEESKHKRNRSRESSNDRDIYAPLSIEVVNSKSSYMPRETTKLSEKFKRSLKQNPKSSIQLRLGTKITHSDDVWSSDESLADSTDHNVMSRVKKINTDANTTSVWSRLENVNNDIDEQSKHGDLRNILKSRKQKKPDDLRERLSKSKQSNLRIEIDNNYAKS